MSNARRPRRLLIPIAVALVGLGAAYAFSEVAARSPSDLGGAIMHGARIARLRSAALSHEIACDRGSMIDCGIAAAMLREGEPDDLAKAATLGARANAMFVAMDANGSRAVEVARELSDEQACERGDADRCTLAARTASRDGSDWRAAALHQLACDAGHPHACETALRAREIAKR